MHLVLLLFFVKFFNRARGSIMKPNIGDFWFREVGVYFFLKQGRKKV